MADFQRHPYNGAPYVNHPTWVTKQDRPARVMYGRPSNFGAQVENRFNLERWSERRTLYGAALINLAGVEELDIDDSDDAVKLDGLVADAKYAAGAHLAAMRGTLTHEFSEYLDRNEESPLTVLNERAEQLGVPSGAISSTLEAYGRALDRYDVHVLAIEQMVVDDRWRLAGRLDRIVRLDKDLQFTDGTVLEAGEVVVFDIKTGRLKVDAKGAPAYWHSYAVQIASYSHSVPYIIAEDSWDEARDEWPWEVSERHGIICHLDIGNAIEEGVATATLFHVDLVAGHKAGNLCRAARDWQSSTGVIHAITGPPVVVNVR